MATHQNHPWQHPKYEIHKELSRGGMGIVLHGHHRELRIDVAIKVLSNDFPSAEDHLRFQREAQVLGQLRHPNIVRVLDFGLHNGLPYLAMEFVPGQDLDVTVLETVKRTGEVPDFDWTASIMEQVAGALDYCHQQELIHRDLKPANILIDSKESPLLIDFGLVKINESTGGKLSATGAMLGTPAYMAPEQVDTSRLVTDKTDVWSFGATLFFALTGRPIYQGSTAYHLYKQVLEDKPPRARSINPRVPDWLDEICHSCLQRNPDDRPTIAEVNRAFIKGEGAPNSSNKGLILSLFICTFGLALLVLFLLIRDKTPPELELSTAPPKQTFSETVTLEGTLSEACTVQINKNKTPCTIGPWKATVPLSPGQNTIRLALTDAWGNTTRARHTVTRLSDTITVGGKDSNFKTISEAVAVAPAGTTIGIMPGQYFEQLKLTKALKFQGLTKGARKVELHLERGSLLINHANTEFQDIDFIGLSPSEPAVIVKAEASFRNCTFSSKQNGLEASGERAKLRSRNCVITSCDGLGLYLSKGQAILEDCEFRGNKGAITAEDGTLELHNCTIMDDRLNSRSHTLNSRRTTLSVIGGKILNSGGQSIQIHESPKFEIRDVVIVGAKKSGISVEQSTGTIVNCNISDCEWAGIKIRLGSTVDIKGCELHKSSTGLAFANYSTGSIKDCNIHHNTLFGVSIPGLPNKKESRKASRKKHQSQPTPLLENLNIHDNLGCGLRLTRAARAKLRNSRLDNNNVAIRIEEYSWAEIESVTITNHQARSVFLKKKGFVNNVDAAVQITWSPHKRYGSRDLDPAKLGDKKTTTLHKVEVSGPAQALHVGRQSLVEVSKSLFTGRCGALLRFCDATFRDCSFLRCTQNGAWVEKGEVRFIACHFLQNTHNGLYVAASGKVIAKNCVASANGHRGMVVWQDGQLDLVDCKILQQVGRGTQSFNIAGVDVAGGRASLKGCAFVKNNQAGLRVRKNATFKGRASIEKCRFVDHPKYAIHVEEGCSLTHKASEFQKNHKDEQFDEGSLIKKAPPP